MSRFIKKYSVLLVLIGLVISFISFNIIFKFISDSIFWDMTDNKRHSLSEVSVEEVRKLSQPVYVTVYYSEEIASENPFVDKYAESVLQFLKQYQQINPNNVFITVKNPVPYSQEEKEAKKAGIKQFLSTNGQTNLYFGAVFKNSDDKTLVIPNFSWERDFWLEKDITDIFVQFNHPQKKIVGIISPVHKMIKREFTKGIVSYAFIQELSERYNILDLAPNTKEIPHDVDVLLLVMPRKMPKTLLYALDQYLMKGGRLIVLADIVSEPEDYQAPLETIRGMNELLRLWGAQISETLVASQRYGHKIFLKTGKDEVRKTPYPLWLDLPSETINQEYSATKGLSDIHLRTPVEIEEQKYSEDTVFTPLLKIDDGAIFHKEEFNMGKNYIVSQYEADKQPHILAALIQGKTQSLFLQAPEFAADNKQPFLFYSAEPAQILLVGDSDFIMDDIWQEEGELNDNGQFILKAVDNMLGEDKLAALYKSQDKNNQESLGGKIYNKIFMRHTETISALQNRLQELKREYDMLKYDVESGTQNIDSTITLRMADIQDEVKTIQSRLQYYNYSIKKAFETQTHHIIFVSMIVIPLGEILLLIWGSVLLTRRYRKKIKEKFNVR